MGELCLCLSRFDEAVPIFQELINRNPENIKYYVKLIEAKQLTDPDEIIRLYKEIEGEYGFAK